MGDLKNLLNNPMSSFLLLCKNKPYFGTSSMRQKMRRLKREQFLKRSQVGKSTHIKFTIVQ